MKNYYEYGLEKVAVFPVLGCAAIPAYPTIMNTLAALGGAYSAYEISDSLMKWMYGKYSQSKKDSPQAQAPAKPAAPAAPPKDVGGGIMGSNFGAQVKAFQKPKDDGPVAAAPAQKAPQAAPQAAPQSAPKKPAGPRPSASRPGFRNAPAPQGAEPGGVWGLANTPEGSRKVYMTPSALKSPIVQRGADGVERPMSANDYAKWYHEKYGPPLKQEKPEPKFNYGTWAGGAPQNPKVREAIRNGTGIFRPSAVEGNR